VACLIVRNRARRLGDGGKPQVCAHRHRRLVDGYEVHLS
jgi:hypothetical protein